MTQILQIKQKVNFWLPKYILFWNGIWASHRQGSFDKNNSEQHHRVRPEPWEPERQTKWDLLLAIKISDYLRNQLHYIKSTGELSFSEVRESTTGVSGRLTSPWHEQLDE